MGIGDEIMASGHALTEFNRTGKRVQICGRDGHPRWSDLWRGLEFVAGPKELGDFTKITNGPQCRPYIRYPFSRAGGQFWTEWHARDHRGVIRLTDEETDFAEKAVAGEKKLLILEPNLSSQSNPNKQWGWSKWQELVTIGRQYNLVPTQMGPANTRLLKGVRHINTPTFRHAVAVMAFARWCIVPECGLHHANAAMRYDNMTVLFGGATSPIVTGYPEHKNIAIGEPCGKWLPCDHCKEVWSNLSPLDVFHYTPRTHFVI